MGEDFISRGPETRAAIGNSHSFRIEGIRNLILIAFALMFALGCGSMKKGGGGGGGGSGGGGGGPMAKGEGKPGQEKAVEEPGENKKANEELLGNLFPDGRLPEGVDVDENQLRGILEGINNATGGGDLTGILNGGTGGTGGTTGGTTGAVIPIELGNSPLGAFQTIQGAFDARRAATTPPTVHARTEPAGNAPTATPTSRRQGTRDLRETERGVSKKRYVTDGRSGRMVTRR